MSSVGSKKRAGHKHDLMFSKSVDVAAAFEGPAPFSLSRPWRKSTWEFINSTSCILSCTFFKLVCQCFWPNNGLSFVEPEDCEFSWQQKESRPQTYIYIYSL